MRQKLVGALLSLALVPACATNADPGTPPVRHLVFITIDGLRPDAIAPARAENLEKLIARSAYSAKARTVGSPETLPSHVSMVTGKSPDSHRITYNKARGKTLEQPSVFTRVQDAGGDTVLLFGKRKMIMLAGPKGASVTQGPGKGNKNWERGHDLALATKFAAEFAATRPMFSMVHLREPDFIGHKKEWMSEEYLAAVRVSDAALGTIVDAIAKAGLADQTAIILTSDHGGEGSEHVEGDDESETIPWLCYTPGLKPQAIKGAVRTIDVAPTAIALLGLKELPRTDGKVVGACLP